jgi:nucleotidyltransferase/DNA polymerase involved in DNA repair
MEYLRYCGIHLPFFSTQVWLQSHPDWSTTPFLIASSGAGGGILHQNPVAARLRIPEKLPLDEIRARWPRLSIVPPQNQAEQAARERLRSFCETRTPLVQWEQDTLSLDLTGTERLFGAGQPAWLESLLSAIRSMGFPWLRAALAPSRNSALLLSRVSHGNRPPLFPTPTLRDHLGRVSLAAVPGVPSDFARRLRNQQIRTLGDLQKKDRRTVLALWGAEGERLYALAQGTHWQSHENETSAPPDSLLLQQAFAPAISMRATLRHECQILAKNLEQTLQQRSQKARALALAITLADGRALRAQGNLGKTHASISSLALFLLDSLPPVGAPAIALEYRAQRLQSIVPQTDLFAAAS